MSEGKTALVLGGLGFIGTNLATRLAGSGWHTVVVDSAEVADVDTQRRLASLPATVNTRHGGIQDRKFMSALLDSVAVDVVFDLAGATGHLSSMDEPQRDIEDNFVFHVQFLNLLREHDLSPEVILASTRQVLGAHAGTAVDDSACPRPVDVNGVSKMALEHYLRVSGAAWGLRSSIVRLPNVYGPYMRTRDARDGVIGGWVGQALKGQTLQIYGTGEGKRNTLYIDDAVGGLIDAVPTASATAPAYLVGGEEQTLAAVAESIASRLGVAVEYVPMPPSQRAIDVGSVVVDDSRFRAATGWQPSVAFDVGLERTLAFTEGQGECGD